ncbi:54S ribosomal protein yml6, mitochondrial [Recurvomyces mirabilis]|uniref:Large ribosomal subunit protein uL4m n=1 Tax=Recurvomyces mirabilis TaxID=574656 RepID=A0AAE1C6H0_9PEZI|nr:54S ribosomal protein yml6, mitochondrial [Recurvomyces mirabilis]KAK5161999.1 54S ribosomal protein yml6, mitochondrial [Recurvomyces mirabilis]
MSAKRLKTTADTLINSSSNSNRWTAHTRQCFVRSLTTQTTTTSPNATIAQAYADAQLASTSTAATLQDRPTIPPPPSKLPQPTRFHPQQQKNPFARTATLTTHAFPSLEPTSLATYPSTHLLLPLRKDILHRAIVYEGDATRQGTANTKTRYEIHGSNRKVRPQKGTGSARLGDKKSPMLRGGGVAFGPRPRDFSTRLQRKVYDLAWRTALSWRYKQGELICVEDLAELTDVHENSADRYLRDFLTHNKLGHQHGRTLFITLERREMLFAAFEAEGMGREGRALEVVEVDVKDLLEMGRVVVERDALEWMFVEHEGDLGAGEQLVQWEKGRGRTVGGKRVGREKVVGGAGDV